MRYMKKPKSRKRKYRPELRQAVRPARWVIDPFSPSKPAEETKVDRARPQ